MKIVVLIGYEESQAVCIAFRERGFEAYSCDLIPCSGGRPEWHLQMDVYKAIDELKPDVGIFHPPCTDTAVSGAKHFFYKKARQIFAIHNFQALLEAPIESICIEQPVSIISTKVCKPTQIVQPYMFGHTERKTTCLWLKNLPILKETNNVKEEMLKLPYHQYAKVHSMAPGPERATLRSKTFPGIAQAMATQWTEYLKQKAVA